MPLRGTKNLLMGPPGSGKTDAIVSFLESSEIEKVCVLGTDPGFEESLYDSVRRRNVDIKKLHHHYTPAASQSFSSFRDILVKANQNGFAELGAMKHGINRHDHQQFLELVDACAEFKCDRTGKNLGPVDEFPHNWVFGFDGLTGLNKMAMQNHVGGKPCLHEGEWQVVQNTEEGFISLLTDNLKCFFVLIAHVSKGYNPVTGQPFITIDATGQKLGPRLPSKFSDVIVAVREGAQFKWSTAEANYDLKNRALPISDKLQPTFVQVVEAWKERNSLFEQGLIDEFGKPLEVS